VFLCAPCGMSGGRVLLLCAPCGMSGSRVFLCASRGMSSGRVLLCAPCGMSGGRVLLCASDGGSCRRSVTAHYGRRVNYIIAKRTAATDGLLIAAVSAELIRRLGRCSADRSVGRCALTGAAILRAL